jgi:TolA-binding protein
VLAQTDASYIGKAEQIAERMKGKLPDGDWYGIATFKLMQIYYHERRWDQARKLCEEIIAKWPNDPEAKEAKRLLENMKP